MVVMSLCYLTAVGLWFFMSTAVMSPNELNISFYGTAGTTIISIMSTWCYYNSLAKIKKERLVKKLINDTD